MPSKNSFSNVEVSDYIQGGFRTGGEVQCGITGDRDLPNMDQTTQLYWITEAMRGVRAKTSNQRDNKKTTITVNAEIALFPDSLQTTLIFPVVHTLYSLQI